MELIDLGVVMRHTCLEPFDCFVTRRDRDDLGRRFGALVWSNSMAGWSDGAASLEVWPNSFVNCSNSLAA